jgi:CheY-like chemotaxis protein
MTIQVWCSIEVFHQSDARTIPAMVNTGGITRDILRALHVRMALDSEGRVAINEVCLPTADMVRLDRQTPVDCMHHTILVVDDDRPIRNLCRLTLEESGYLVSEATNGKNALAAIEETEFDLIVLDLSMPDTDGFEFLKGVRAKSPKPKILVISGFLGGTMLAAAKLFGAAATLAKPFSPDSLLLVVSEVLASKGPAGSSD